MDSATSPRSSNGPSSEGFGKRYARGTATDEYPRPPEFLVAEPTLIERQEFANSSIKASKIAGYSNTRITEECPIVS